MLVTTASMGSHILRWILVSFVTCDRPTMFLCFPASSLNAVTFCVISRALRASMSYLEVSQWSSEIKVRSFYYLINGLYLLFPKTYPVLDPIDFFFVKHLLEYASLIDDDVATGGSRN